MKVFFFLILTFSSTLSLRLHCKFVQSEVFGYGCHAINFKILNGNDRTITEVVGIHFPGKTHNDVTAFSSYGQEVRFIPLGLTNFFPNLKLFEIAQANLAKISPNDLEQFGPKLSYIFFGENKLKTIRGDLFKFTPNLRWIDLNHNQISQVEPGTFSNLKSLYRISFINNLCYKGEAKYGALPMAIKRIEKQCSKHPGGVQMHDEISE